ncbi:MAG: cysteine hydrolase [Deltaproteobacteria bacterium]|nr:cysteine hydrolase [Deltaproteobacteria bacterium]
MKTRTKIKLAIAVVLVALIGVYTAVFVPFGPTVGEKIDDYDNPHTALLLMDMQVDLVDKDGRLPVDQGQVPAMLAATNGLLARAQERGVEPIYVINTFSKWDVIGNLFRNQAVIAGSKGARLDPRLKVVSKALFAKDMPDAFTNLEFDEHLRKRQINHIVMAGVFADQCVRATAIGALNRGYKVTVLKEAVAAASTEDRDQAYRDLEEDGATVISVDQFISQSK